MAVWINFIAIHLILLVVSLNINAVSVAFPDITRDFDTSLVVAGWVLSIYQLIATCSAVIIGKLSEVFGKKNTFIVCIILFTLGSFLSAIAPSIELLIFFRLIQAVGGGGIVPSTVGILIDLFPNSRQKIIGISMSFFSIGGVVGPSVGAWLITSFDWRAIFWFNVPAGIVACIPLIFLLKKDHGQKSHIDFKGAGLFAGALFAIMIGITQIGDSKDVAGWFLVGFLLAAGIIFALLFIRHEFRAKDPIVHPELLRLKPFAAGNYYNFLFGFSVFGFTTFLPLYAVTVFSMTTLESGIVLAVKSAGTIVATMITSFFLVRWGYRKPMLIGTIITSAGIILIVFWQIGGVNLGSGLSSVTALSMLSVLTGAGIGITMPASSNACLDLMPHRATSISGIRVVFRQSSWAIGIAVITLVLQFLNNMEMGFIIVLIGAGLINLLCIPFIYAMPERAGPPLQDVKVTG